MKRKVTQMNFPRGIKSEDGFQYRFIPRSHVFQKQDEGWEIVRNEEGLAVSKNELIFCRRKGNGKIE